MLKKASFSISHYKMQEYYLLLSCISPPFLVILPTDPPTNQSPFPQKHIYVCVYVCIYVYVYLHLYVCQSISFDSLLKKYTSSLDSFLIFFYSRKALQGTITRS